MRAVRVFSKPDCMQCEFTKKFLDEHSINYTMVNVYEDEEAKDYVESLGFQSLPVVEIEGEAPFYGFRPDRLGVLLREDTQY